MPGTKRSDLSGPTCSFSILWLWPRRPVSKHRKSCHAHLKKRSQKRSQSSWKHCVDLLEDVLSGKNIKTAVKAPAPEGVGMGKDKVLQPVQTFAQPERGSKKPTRRQPKRQAAKKGKASMYKIGSSSAKRRKTSSEAIFG